MQLMMMMMIVIMMIILTITIDYLIIFQFRFLVPDARYNLIHSETVTGTIKARHWLHKSTELP